MDGVPEDLIKKLKRVQNTVARLVISLRKYDSKLPALATLHWLPVKYQIEFKTLLIIFIGLHDPKLHPTNDHPIKKQKIFHDIQWNICPEGSKIQAH